MVQVPTSGLARSYKMTNKYTTYETVSGGTLVLLQNEDGSQTHIPMVEGNSDYARYLRWLENPNEVEHLTEIPPQAALSTPNV